MADDLKLNVTEPSIYQSVLTDCCSALGISCTSNRVTKIQWNSKGLNGVLKALPPLLNELFLHGNSIYGNIPILPTSLTVMNIGTNKFNGSLINLPPNMRGLYVQDNMLSGAIPGPFPSGLWELFLYGNNFVGELPNLPLGINILYLNWWGYTQNRISGTVLLDKPAHVLGFGLLLTDLQILDTSAITWCNFDDNPLLGNPNIANLTMCSFVGIYAPPIATTSFTQVTSSAFESNQLTHTVYISSEATSPETESNQLTHAVYISSEATSPETKSRILTQKVFKWNNVTQSVPIGYTTNHIIDKNPNEIVFFYPLIQIWTIWELIMKALRIGISIFISGIIFAKTPIRRKRGKNKISNSKLSDYI